MLTETSTISADEKKVIVTPEQALTLLTTVLSYMRDAGAQVPRRIVDGELQLRIRFDGLDITKVERDGVISYVLVERAVSIATMESAPTT